MIVGIILSLFLVALFFVSGVTANWEAIRQLEGPQASFLGAMIGLFGGVVTLLAGALVNAEINRRRDDRLRDEDARLVATALAAELNTNRALLCNGLLQFVRAEKKNEKVLSGDLQEIYAVNTAIFESLFDKIGHLPAETIENVLRTYAHINTGQKFFSAFQKVNIAIQERQHLLCMRVGSLMVLDCIDAARILQRYAGLPDSVGRFAPASADRLRMAVGGWTEAELFGLVGFPGLPEGFSTVMDTDG